MVKEIQASITCTDCGKVYEYLETRNLDSMPDGEFISGKWYCTHCLVVDCDECHRMHDSDGDDCPVTECPPKH